MVFDCPTLFVIELRGTRRIIATQPATIENPFYMLVPEWGLYPMIGLATAAAVIASQAVITGVFSMVNQIIQLRYLPRLTVRLRRMSSVVKSICVH